MKMMKSTILCAFLVLSLNNVAQNSFALGADVGWLTEMEAAGRKFYTAAGVEKECMQLLKEDIGMNAIRLRVWVNPSGGWNGLADVLKKSKRAHSLGMDLMINFHYSDSWADPGKQTKPAAWVSYNFEQLKQAVYNHTYEVLDTLRKHGITPKWVQVGNETGNGMLWEDGKASVSMAKYAQLTNAGYDAVKAISQDIKVIVHVHNGYDNGLFRWIFDGLKNNGGKWDVIGMSLYPNWYKTANDWANANKDCLVNMNDMVNRYGKEVMVVECGMSWDLAGQSYLFLTDLIAKVKSVNGGKGTGVLYWEPQSYGNWKAYSLGAFNNSGRPTIALDAFRNAVTSTSETYQNKLEYRWNKEIREISFPVELNELRVYQANGVLTDTVYAIQSYRMAEQLSGVIILEALHREGRDLIRIII
jgi:arabinogalactan endo-1,4-beta-galactosidase